MTAPPPPPPFCGDGNVEGGEQCDGRVGLSCTDVGFGVGRLGCDGRCQFDVSGCTPAPPTCTTSVPTSLPPACVSALCSCDPMGLAACDGDCLARLECALRECGADGLTHECVLTSCRERGIDHVLALQLSKCIHGNVLCAGVGPPPPTCGNGVIDGSTRERCEPGNLLGQTCQSRGFSFGTLACDPRTCQLDTSGCGVDNPFCGNGVAELGSESCDGGDLAGQSCRSLGLGRGTLWCNAACGFETGDCRSCGDGRVHPGEVCDGTRLQGQSCVSLGYSGGTLRCDGDCNFDASGCALCGDSVIGAGENCDGADLRGASCSSLGLGAGTLACSAASCHYDTRNCAGTGFCGNGIAEADEQCDGMDLVSHDCTSLGLGFDGGSLGCNQATCRYDVSGCERSSGSVCLNRCIDGNCASLIDRCDQSPDCHQVLDCLDSCLDNASLDCTARCIVGIPNGANLAIVAADCVADCALDCR
jgi:hypothetical protein